ncbi:LytTR family transcriptional regulator DNA-binding domain-containing protein, partial [[Clostridium] scindens]|uniref:LytTR family transcriptional regulator DNA-binding domain-containing protein n=1 Tax=Clostridium scindens (strain JCM 10418 / VPI 12708) TaxID=29347 RepID=UPI001D089B1E
FNKETVIHTTHGDIYAKLQMAMVETIISDEQPELVVRVHKSFCASRYYIESLCRYELRLYGGHTIPVSRSG